MPGLDDVKLGYVATLDDAMEFKRWLGERHGGNAIGLDTETTGLNAYEPGAKIRLMQFGDAVTGWAIPWEDWRGLAIEALNAWEGDWVGHNLGAFDRKWIEQHSPYRFADHRVHDTMIQAHIVDPLGPGGLKKLADRYVDRRSSAGQHLLDEAKAKNKWTWATVPVDLPAYWVYSALDPVLTIRLHELYQKKIGFGGAYAGIYDLEMAVRHVVTRMEQLGARVDMDYSRAKYEELSEYSGKVKAWARAKHGLLLSSNKQLADWFESQGEEITIFSEKTGGPSVDKQQLKIFLESENPDVIELVTQTLNMRKASKLASSYFGNFVNFSVHESGGDFVHPSIKTLGARTARMSISAPALQQVPKQDATVRRSFIPRDGNKLVTVDYSQIEMRMTAHFSHDADLIAAFAEADRTGGDFFVEIGKEVYQEPEFQKSDKRRGLLKNTMYGLCYGAGVNKMAASAGVPVDRMAAVVKGLETRFPGIRRFMREVEDLGVRRERAEGQGYIITPIGRRLPCDEGRVYTLTNYTIQSSAADVLKRAIVDLDSAGYGPYMTLPVHDEVVFDLPEADVEQALKEIPEIMADTVNFSIPLLAEAEGPFDNWGEKYASK